LAKGEKKEREAQNEIIDVLISHDGGLQAKREGFVQTCKNVLNRFIDRQAD
jgi:hypothetical protein